MFQSERADVVQLIPGAIEGEAPTAKFPPPTRCTELALVHQLKSAGGTGRAGAARRSVYKQTRRRRWFAAAPPHPRAAGAPTARSRRRRRLGFKFH